LKVWVSFLTILRFQPNKIKSSNLRAIQDFYNMTHSSSGVCENTLLKNLKMGLRVLKNISSRQKRNKIWKFWRKHFEIRNVERKQRDFLKLLYLKGKSLKFDWKIFNNFFCCLAEGMGEIWQRSKLKLVKISSPFQQIEVKSCSA
jgi:hypothetical protein